MTIPLKNDFNFISSMGGPSHEAIVLAQALLKEGPGQLSVLDLGCGDGRNSFVLSENNIAVTSVDNSQTNIAKLKELNKLFNKGINIVKGEVSEFKFAKQYRAILAHGLLHFLSKTEISDILGNTKKFTSDGGINIFTTAFFDFDADVIADFKKAGHKNALNKGELIEYYKDWELISHEIYNKWDFHPGTGNHNHPIEKWIFRKPGEIKVNLVANELILDKRIGTTIINTINNFEIIGKKIEFVIGLLGSPDYIFQYEVRGPQFSYTRFSKLGYCLKLFFWGNIMIYLSDGIISGYSQFESNFFDLIAP